MIDDETLDLLREESQEHLSSVESSLLDLESTGDPEARRRLIDEAFRHAHTMKGTARAVGLRELESLGQVLEETLHELREDPPSATPETIAKALSEFDALRTAYHLWDEGNEGKAAEPLEAAVQTSAPPPKASPTSLIDEEILELFHEETREHVSALENLLLDLEGTEDARERRNLIDNVFRHAHTVKGSSRAVGMTEIQNSAQLLEDTLDELREDPEGATREAIGKALVEFDAVKQAYHRWESNRQQDTGGMDAAKPAAARADLEETTPPVSTTPARGGKTSEERLMVRVLAARLDRMLSLAGEVRVLQRGSDTLELQLGVITEVVANALTDCKRFDDKLSRQPSVADAQALKEPADRLRSQVESAVERLRQLQSDFGKKRFREELLVEALEHDIRSARLVPLANLTDSMRRAVRDLVQSLGKPIIYQPDVGDTLLDKAVMESLKDPLMHMIRNAADHGIESPEARVAAGKSKEGIISVTASRRAESVRIRVSDNGGGIDFNRIRQKLKQEAGMDEAEIAALSEKELARFLFQAGFSTKQQATEVSGRGVGMDVVLDAIHRLQGTVELERSSADGTTFLITVPVTISTARILTVTSGGQRYGIPTTSVVRTGRLREESLKDIEGNPVLSVDGKPVRWVELSDLLGAPRTPVLKNGDHRAYMLLLHEGRQLALAVEEFEDEAEVILKSLEFPLTELDEVIGGTIRPDGLVQLVLDPSWLMSKALQVGRRAAPVETKAAAQLLVVDDSPTTRSMLRNVFAAAGYAVQTAADGVDALERLRARPFDLVVSDVEMPRMNGFELTRQVKARFKLPVVLVTSLEKEEDRRQGLQAGADAYVVKSMFEDQSLLEIIQQLV